MRLHAVLLQLAALLTFNNNHSSVLAQTTCRKGKNKIPHIEGLWQADFPHVDVQVEALCEGTVTRMADGEICIEGRVSYEQLSEALGGTPIPVPSVSTISIQGHLLSGSGNVGLGTRTNFIQDFVTKYTLEGGVQVTAGPELTDQTLVASRGLIEGLCLDRSFTREEEEELYAITHDIWLPGSTNFDKLRDANAIYIGRFSIVAEYITPSNLSPFFGTITHTLANFINQVGVWLFPNLTEWMPILGVLGLQRLFIIGTVSSAQIPNPVQTSIDTGFDATQIDTEWTTLLSAMEDGLFTKDKVPFDMGIVIKKVEPLNDRSCWWPHTTAGIDIEALKGQGAKVDQFIRDTVLPYLNARGNVGLHFGKRVDSTNSEMLDVAFDTYNRLCGVAVNLDLDPTNCYHPVCRRSSVVTNFTYPPHLYQPRKQVPGKKSSSDDSHD